MNGQPQVMVCGVAKEIARERGIGDILVSISHCRTYATAYAMARGRGHAAPSRHRLTQARIAWPDSVLGRSCAPDSSPFPVTSAVIFASVASPGSLVPLHLGYLAQPRKKPRRPRRTIIGPPQSSQVSSTSIDFRSVRGLAGAAAACSASCSLSSSGTWAVPRHLG